MLCKYVITQRFALVFIRFYGFLKFSCKGTAFYAIMQVCCTKNILFYAVWSNYCMKYLVFSR